MRPTISVVAAPRIPRDELTGPSGLRQRWKLLEAQGAILDYISGRRRIPEEADFDGNIENFIGLAQVPVGIVGPLRVLGTHARGDFYVPLATTEGALVASYNRGAKVVTVGGGAHTLCVSARVSRAPAFVFATLAEAVSFVEWIAAELDALRAIAASTSHHARLEDVRPTVLGNHVHLECEFTTGDAAGQNMVTVAAEALCRHIVARAPVRPRRWFVEGNLSGDKKATAKSFLSVRGRRVIAEAIAPRDAVIGVCQTTPEAILEYAKVSMPAAVQSGAIGAQGHYANALAALFIACGQDAACVAEASVGITRVDVVGAGDLYVSVTLPNLIVGTIGGGTDLPTQRECLGILGCTGSGTATKFAEIAAATVLAGEISITAALAAGQFTQAHVKYARRARP